MADSGKSTSAIEAAIRSFKETLPFYICTGNDLTFLKKYVPDEVRSWFDGYILETGCVIGTEDSETIGIPKNQETAIKELEAKLKKLNYPQIKYFARRLITISMFTRDEHDGVPPEELHEIVSAEVLKMGISEEVLVTYSNVAVDIIPRGYNKMTGLQDVALENRTVGIADSMNDWHMLFDSDYSFMPANASKRLQDVLSSSGRRVKHLDPELKLKRDAAYISDKPNTEGVIDILGVFAEHLGV